MHDSASPSPSSPDPQSPSGPAPGAGDENMVGAEEARQIVGAVIAWYNRHLLLARRSGDQQRVDELTSQRQKCMEDQALLQDAGPEEIARIADFYTARLTELESSEPPAEA